MDNQPAPLNVSGFKLPTLPIKLSPKSLMIIGVVIILLIAGGVGFWYWSKNRQVPKEVPTLGSEIFENTQNPLGGKVPDTNPFADQPNPFGDKTNPIEKAYTNPF